MNEEKQKVVDAVIEEIARDLLQGDSTVLEEILSHVPMEILIHSLPEEEWPKYSNYDTLETDIWNSLAKGLSQ